ncbi:MAG: MFS transporter [Actinobacteria bacterium]|nr:MFS transporter [Actinomycetota bacterium]
MPEAEPGPGTIGPGSDPEKCPASFARGRATYGDSTCSAGGSTGTRSLRDRLQLATIAGALFVVWTGFGAVLPYLPVFLREEAHASVSLIGLVAAAYYLGVVSFAGLFGLASDRIGRKPLLVVGVCLYATATLLFITTTHPGWFVLFRFLEGVGAAAVYPAGMAFVADISTDANRSRSFGWLTSAQFAGLVAGPALAVPLYALGGGQGRWAFYSIFLFGSCLSWLVAVALALVLKEPARVARARRIRRTDKMPVRRIVSAPIVAFLVVAATSNFTMGAFEVVWSLWLRSLGASMSFVGATWVAFSLPMLLSFVGGRLADRHSRFFLMFLGFGMSAVAWITYGLVQLLPFLLIMNAVEGLSIALAYPAKAAFLVQVSPRAFVGTVQGMESTAGQFAGLAGTIIAPVLYERLGGLIMTVGGVLSLIGLTAVAPTLRREWRRLTEEKMVAMVVEAEMRTPLTESGGEGGGERVSA